MWYYEIWNGEHFVIKSLPKFVSKNEAASRAKKQIEHFSNENNLEYSYELYCTCER